MQLTTYIMTLNNKVRYKMGKVKELLYDEEQGNYKDIEEIADENAIAAFEKQVEEQDESERV